jgi:hypothetical protein
VRTIGHDGAPTETFLSGEPVRIEIGYRLYRPFANLVPGVQLVGPHGEYLYGAGAELFRAPGLPGEYRLLLELPSGPFVGGIYSFSIGLNDHQSETEWQQVAYRNRLDSFRVLPISLEEGIVRIPTVWSLAGPDAGRPAPLAPTLRHAGERE